MPLLTSHFNHKLIYFTSLINICQYEGENTKPKSMRATTTNPLVTIVIPAFNCAQTIAETIASVTAQSYQSIEIIVIDDHSTDNTVAVVLGLGLPSLQLVTNRTNLGAHQTVNVGYQLANGRFVAYLDADDLLPPTSIQDRVMLLLATGADAVHGGETVLHNGRRQYFSPCRNDAEITQFLTRKSPGKGINLHTLMVKRKVFDKVGYRKNDVMRFNADYEFMLRVLLNTTSVALDKSCYIYRRNSGVLSKNMAKPGWHAHHHQIEQDYLKAFSKKLDLLDELVELSA